MQDKKDIEKLLQGWESIFRQGLLTFWTFVVLDGVSGDVGTIRTGVERLTGGSYQPSEQVLYRQLRRHTDVGLVNRHQEATPNGPPKNIFELSELGGGVLKEFANRNIRPFNQPAVQAIIERGAK
ncbi:PadR family transcriptional regulator [Microbacterium lacticum]|uniref:PadR family transcriptional regulator n=1 Tax=Microbacterium lacticum TaxID=33885 RepID=UPI003A8AB454